MGCDIHMNVLVREAGAWTLVSPPRNHEAAPGAWDEYRWPGDARNYAQFGFMTGGVVRGRSPFDNMFPEPRGYKGLEALGLTLEEEWTDTPPADIALETKWEQGDHSFSYLTLEELRAMDWKQKSKRESAFPGPDVAEWLSAGAPGCGPAFYSGYARRERAEIDVVERYLALTPDEQAVLDTQEQLESAGRVYLDRFEVSIEYLTTPAKELNQLCDLMNLMAGLAQPKDVTDVVLVFSFDS